jgi:hypothetical protein
MNNEYWWIVNVLKPFKLFIHLPFLFFNSISRKIKFVFVFFCPYKCQQCVSLNIIFALKFLLSTHSASTWKMLKLFININWPFFVTKEKKENWKYLKYFPQIFLCSVIIWNCWRKIRKRIFHSDKKEGGKK